MDSGNLRAFLRHVSGEKKMRPSLVSFHISDLPRTAFTEGLQMLGIADGLDYLHSMQPRIIHDDLKAVSDHFKDIPVARDVVLVNVLVTNE